VFRFTLNTTNKKSIQWVNFKKDFHVRHPGLRRDDETKEKEVQFPFLG